MIKAVVFDLDGTLVDSAPDIAGGINRMLAEYALGPLPMRDIERLTGEGASVLVARVLERLGVAADEARVARDTASYLTHYQARPCVDSRLFADAAEAVATLRQAGIRLGVCTNKPEALAAVVLRELGLLYAMDVIVGADTTPVRKPDPLPLLAAQAFAAFGDAIADADAAAPPGREIEWQMVAYVRFAVAAPGRFRLMFGPRRSAPEGELAAVKPRGFNVLQDRVDRLSEPTEDRAAKALAYWSLERDDSILRRSLS